MSDIDDINGIAEANAVEMISVPWWQFVLAFALPSVVLPMPWFAVIAVAWFVLTIAALGKPR